MSQFNADVPGALIGLPLCAFPSTRAPFRPLSDGVITVHTRFLFPFVDLATPPILSTAVALNDRVLHAHPVTRSCVTKCLFLSIVGAQCRWKHLFQRRLQLWCRGLGGAFQGTSLGDRDAP